MKCYFNFLPVKYFLHHTLKYHVPSHYRIIFLLIPGYRVWITFVERSYYLNGHRPSTAFRLFQFEKNVIIQWILLPLECNKMNVRCIRNVVSITSLKANVDLVNLNVYEIEKKKIEISFVWILHYCVHMISFNILIRECSFYCINWWLSFYFKNLI